MKTLKVNFSGVCLMGLTRFSASIKLITPLSLETQTMNMLGLAKRVKARFLLASTSEVYGDPQEHPQREGYFGGLL